MRCRIRIVATLVAVAAAAGGLAASRQSGGGRSIVTVIDEDRRPVLGLDQEDFSLRDGALRRAVLGAEPATEPLSVVVVLAGWEAEDAPEVRRAVSAFVAAMHRGSALHAVAILSGDARAGRRVMPLPIGSATIDADIERSIAAGSGGLVDAVIDAGAAQRRSPADRRAIALVAKRGAVEGAPKAHYEIMDALVNARAALWTVELNAAPGKGGVDDLLAAGSDAGGALRTTIARRSEVGAALTRLADLLLSQYVVTYAWPDPMLSQLTIATRHSRGQVLAPVW